MFCHRTARNSEEQRRFPLFQWPRHRRESRISAAKDRSAADNFRVKQQKQRDPFPGRGSCLRQRGDLPSLVEPDVLAAVAGGTPAYPDIAIAVRAHVVADAIYRSAAAKGEAVDCG